MFLAEYAFLFDSAPASSDPCGSSPPLLIGQQKIPFGYFRLMVRVEGVGPSSLAWEANIIAVIRYPQ